MRKSIIVSTLLVLGTIIFIFTFLSRHNQATKLDSITEVPVRKFQFWYELRIKNLSADSKQVTVWVPVPESNAYQKISDLRVTSDYPYTFYKDREYGNRILKVEANTKVLENLQVSMNFVVTRNAYSVWREPKLESDDATDKTLLRYLSPDRLVPITGLIQQEASKVVREDVSDLEKISAIYDYVSATLTYDKSGIGWGRGDAIYACNAKKGNCTDFHSLLIGMARAAGIPARFVMGFPISPEKIQGEVPGYHCWAEFYIEGLGWVPVDASEASQHPELHQFYFGSLDASRVEFTVGRDIQIDSDASIEPQNYFIYPHVVVNGQVYTDVEAEFRFAELSTGDNSQPTQTE